MDVGRTLMLSMPNLKYELWAEAVNTDCFICNWLVTKSTNQICKPYNAIYGKKPYVGHFYTIRCRAYVFKPQHRRKGKFDSRAEEEILVRYCCSDTIRIPMNDIKRVIESKDVTFDEERHPTISNERDQVIEFDLTNQNILVGDLKIVQERKGPDNEVRQT